jgi:hypothetical protein
MKAVSGLDYVHLAVGLVEFDGTVAKSEERPIAAYADSLAGMMFGTALTNDNSAGEYFLAAK